MMLISSRILGCQRLIKNPVSRLWRNWHENAIRVTWEGPQVGWTKLNFDGSCKCSTGATSIGGVRRDHNAEFLMGYAESIGRTTSTIAEMAALRRGLELVLENGWNQVWLEGDFLTLVEIIMQGRHVRSAEAQKQVSGIKLLIPELDNFLITHVYREGNRAAHSFAQMGIHRFGGAFPMMAYAKSCEKMQRVRSYTVEDRLECLRDMLFVAYDQEKNLSYCCT